MSLEGVLSQMRSEAKADLLEIAERVDKRLALLDLRERQLHQRVRALEARWGIGLPEDGQVPLRRSEYRRAKIPRRPKLMRERGDGVDPPIGDSEWALMK
jgi:hypothetical protein